MKSFLIKLYKQRILELIEPSLEISSSYIKKSESNFSSAKILIKNNKIEEPVYLIYYSMYNLVLALLFACGIKCENHSASIFLLKDLFEIENKEISYARKERIEKQYYVSLNLEKFEVLEDLKVAEIFNSNLKGFILGLNSEKIKNFRNKLKEVLKK
jgi:uncharacterized protein (UPF0332 family)